MTNEAWKPIPGYETFYAASNLGRIKRLSNTPSRKRERILISVSQGTGYMRVTLSTDGHATSCYVHRLVAQTFFGPCPPGYQVNHKNGHRDDNRLDNLEYLTVSANNLHAVRFLGRQTVWGERNGMSRLTEQQVKTIKEYYLSPRTMSYREIGATFGVHWSTVRNIAIGLRWRHIK